MLGKKVPVNGGLMKIKTQLLGIILLISGAFILAASFFFVIEAQKSVIERERAVLTNLRQSLSAESMFLTTFCFGPLTATVSDYAEISKATDDAFAQVSSITVLASRSESIKEAIGKIDTMNEMIGKRRQSLLNSVENFLVQGEKVGGFRNSLRLMNFSLVRYYSTKAGYDDFLVLSAKLGNDILVMTQSFTNSIAIIDEQYAIIDEEIANFTRQSIAVCILLALLLGSAGVVLSVMMANRISRRVSAMEEAVRAIKQRRFAESRGDLG